MSLSGLKGAEIAKVTGFARPADTILLSIGEIRGKSLTT